MSLFRRTFRYAALATAGIALAACAHAFNPAAFRGGNEALYAATVREYQRERWDNAVAGFERLTLELAARDTLLPLSHYWMARAHGHRNEHLLAAQAYARVTEGWPDHPLADDALYAAARSYHKMWRKPTLDAQYGETALATYRLYLAMYPNGEQRAEAERQLAALEQGFATKEYEVGRFYQRRKYFDSALIYFRNVVTTYPNTPRAREAYLRMIETYRDIRYAEDARETCAEARRRYPTDAEVRLLCPGAPSTAAADTSRATPADTTRPPAPRPPAR